MKDFLIQLEKVEGDAICYNIDILRSTMKKMKNDFSVIPQLNILFAIKANNHPIVLQTLATLDIGADCASMEEVEYAINAGIKNISVTGPGFEKKDIEELIRRDIDFDFDNYQQISEYISDKKEGKIRIGIRIKKQGYDSRFGLDIEDREFNNLILKNNCVIERIHFHYGEKNFESLSKLLKDIICLLKNHSELKDVKTINLGGGFENIYFLGKDRNMIDMIKHFSEEVSSLLGRVVNIVIEPGSLIGLPFGFLKTSTLSVYDRELLATLRVSAFNLSTWHKLSPIFHNGTYIWKHEPTEYKYQLVGNTCFEQDIFGSFYFEEQLSQNDVIILYPIGAYNFNLRRNLHGVQPPRILVFSNGTFYIDE